MSARKSSLLRAFLVGGGIKVNLEVFSDLSVDVPTCNSGWCAHNHSSSLRGLVNYYLDCSWEALLLCEISNSTQWEPLSSEPFQTFLDMARRLLPAISQPAAIFDNTDLDWDDKWSAFLQTDNPSLKECYESSLNSLRARHEDALWDTLKNIVARSGMADIGQPHQEGDVIVCVKSLPGLRAMGLPYGLLNHLYGHSSLPWVSMLPARMLTKRTVKQAHERFGVQHIKGWRGSHVWFFGEVPCEEPVELLSEHTPEVLETAATLMETLTLKEALAAALTV